MLELILFVIFGIFVGFSSGFFGIGGGGIVISALVTFGYHTQFAIGVSVMQMMFSSIFGSFINYKKALFKLNDSLFVAIGGFFGALFSGFIVKNVPVIVLEITLCIILTLGVIKFFMRKSFAENEISLNKITLCLLGFVIAIISISAGIGGGILISVVFFGFLGYDIKKAVSMGLFFVLFASLSGFMSMSYNGLISYKHGFALGFGALLGVYFGTNLQANIDRKIQKHCNLLLNITMLILIVRKIIFIS